MTLFIKSNKKLEKTWAKFALFARKKRIFKKFLSFGLNFRFGFQKNSVSFALLLVSTKYFLREKQVHWGNKFDKLMLNVCLFVCLNAECLLRTLTIDINYSEANGHEKTLCFSNKQFYVFLWTLVIIVCWLMMYNEWSVLEYQ